MAQVFSGFVGPWNATLGYDADSQRAINLYPRPVESRDGKAQNILRGTPGLDDFCTLATTPVRGLLSAGSAAANRLFAVGGSKLYEVSSGGVATLLGDVGDDASHTPVTMELNGGQLLIGSAGQAYTDSGIGPTSVGIPTAKQIAYIDGYGIALRPSSRQFDISALNDFGTWDALDFDIKSGYPDYIGGILADHKHLWLFGELYGTEIWEHTGNPDFPFERVHSIQQGIAAPWSAVRLMNGVAWIGQDTRGKFCAWWAQGFQPQRVSTYAIEEELSLGGISTLSDCISWSQVWNGHHFWWLQFPTRGKTFVFDATTGWWHERSYWTGSALQRHRARCHAFCFDQHLVGDHTSGIIYKMSDTYGNDNGAAIHRIRQAPHVSENHEPLFHHKIRFNAQTDASSTPNWYLQYSDDKGGTWSTERQVTTPAGFNHQPKWSRKGESIDRIWSLRTDVNSNLEITDAFLHLTKGKRD